MSAEKACENCGVAGGSRCERSICDCEIGVVQVIRLPDNIGPGDATMYKSPGV